MGTNYYLLKDVCSHCGHAKEKKHIGKSSAGWCFSLHVIPEEGIVSLADWKEYWKDGVIQDEYGKTISEEEMISHITDRSCGKRNITDIELNENSAQRGPNGLLRHKIDGWHCVGHGCGTFDFIKGDFS